MIFKNKQEKIFGPSGSFAGYILMLAGVLTIHRVIGIIPLSIGAIVAFSHYGIIIDTEDNKFKHYLSILGILIGHWISLKNVSEIIIVKRSILYGVFSQSNREHITRQTSIRLYFYNQAPRIRVNIKSFKFLNEALEYASVLSEHTGLPVKNYVPKKND